MGKDEMSGKKKKKWRDIHMGEDHIQNIGERREER